MKIKDVKVYLVNAVWRNFVIVKIETDEGITGYGEGTMGDFEKTVEAAVYDFKQCRLTGPCIFLMCNKRN